MIQALRAALDRRLIVFLFVGGLNTLFGYACFVTLILVGLPYPLALLVGTVLGVLFNFKTTGTIVFANRDNRRLIRFVGVYAILYGLNLLGLSGLLRLGLSVYVASALLIVPMALLGFALNKALVFREPT